MLKLLTFVFTIALTAASGIASTTHTLVQSSSSERVVTAAALESVLMANPACGDDRPCCRPSDRKEICKEGEKSCNATGDRQLRCMKNECGGTDWVEYNLPC
jgi:hypothetical protein